MCIALVVVPLTFILAAAYKDTRPVTPAPMTKAQYDAWVEAIYPERTNAKPVYVNGDPNYVRKYGSDTEYTFVGEYKYREETQTWCWGGHKPGEKCECQPF